MSVLTNVIIDVYYMEKTVIIYAHPNKKGFCGEYLNQCIAQLTERQCKYEIVDLYAIGYDPVLKNEEHYTSGGYQISEENKFFQQMIMDAKNLIFIYPTWWQNLPAILKGFIDRVFVARFGFVYKNGLPVGLLKGRHAIVFTSSGGPRLYSKFLTGDRALKILVKDVLRFCGINARGFAIGGAQKFTDENKEDIRIVVKKGLKFLF